MCGEVTHKADDCPKDTAGPKQKEGKRAAPQEDEEEEKEREVEEEPKKKKRVKDVKF